jgi:putative aminopeptidase FrvX
MIKELAEAFGPPGFEGDVIEIARKYIPAGARIVQDSIKNLYICPKNEQNPDLPTVLVDAHSDEVGLMIQAIRDNGTMTFVTLGMWVPATLAAQKVRIKNIHGEIVHGVIASKPPHFAANQDAALKFEEMVIDVGATCKQDAIENFGMAPALPAVPFSSFKHDEKNAVIGCKAFDCRLGCASVLQIMNKIQDMDLNVNVVGVLSAQEEVGMRGAKVVTNVIKPDLAICFEGTPADDTVTKPDLSQTMLKKGPMLRHYDPGMITHPDFMRFALDVAAKRGIPAQQAVRSGGYTNGAAIHLSHLGIPTIVIGHPVRYIHSPNSIAALEDYENGTKLAVEILKALNKDEVMKIRGAL